MKRKANKILSLLMALVMVIGMMPVALATEPATVDASEVTNWTEWTGAAEGSTCEHAGGDTAVVKQAATCTATGTAEQTCTATQDCTAKRTGTIAKAAHTPDTEAPIDYITEGGKHYVKCTVCNGKADEGTDCAAASTPEYIHDADKHYLKCDTCKQKIGTGADHEWAYTDVKDATHDATCSVCSKSGDDVAHEWTYTVIDTAKHSKRCACGKEVASENHTSNCACGYKPAALELTITDDLTGTSTNYDYDEVVTLTVTAAVKTGTGLAGDTYDFTYSWSGDADMVRNDNTKAVVDTTIADASATCTVTAYLKGTNTRVTSDKITWEGTLETDLLDVEASIYNGNNGYTFAELDDKGEESVLEQIYDTVSSRTVTLDYVTFFTVYDDVSDCELSADTRYTYYYEEDDVTSRNSAWLGDVVFTPDKDYVGEAVFYYLAVAVDSRGNETERVGAIVFNVEEGADGYGIVYTAVSGEEIQINEDDLVAFWDEEYPRGSLTSVEFTDVTSGDLYDNYAAGSKKWTDVVADEITCYLSPKSKQTGLDDLTYVPAKRTTTATITFEATGKTGKNATQTDTLTGTITILYTKAEVTPIHYAVAGNVALDPADFEAKYEEVMDTTLKNNATLQIQFLETPSKGTLYKDYAVKSGKVTGTELKDSTIANIMYTTSTGNNAKNKLEDITYVPGKTTGIDTVTFACYSGSTLKFIGTVTFGNVPTNLSVTYSCTNTGVTFKASDFYAGTNSAIKDAAYITFGTPTAGKLYTTSAATTQVTATNLFTYTSKSGFLPLSSVTYKPNAGFAGTALIPFTAYNAAGSKLGSGSVSIRVTANNITFTDVTVGAWYYNDVMTLARAGIVEGKGYNLFDPEGTVTYGEALKMILLAVGYDIQPGTGANWAQPYLTVAVQAGLVSSNINLNAPIDRATIAAIAAKALRLSPVTGGTSPFGDCNDGYARALYNAGIIKGSLDNGKIVYRPTSSIKRCEIAAIILRINNYRG